MANVTLCNKGIQVTTDSKTWAIFLNFLNKIGWKPSIPTYYFLDNLTVSEEDTYLLKQVADIVLDEIGKDPLSAVQAMPFEYSLLAEVSTLCEAGSIRIVVGGTVNENTL